MKSNALFGVNEAKAAAISTIPAFDAKKTEVLKKQKIELEEKANPIRKVIKDLEKQLDALKDQLYSLDNEISLTESQISESVFYRDRELTAAVHKAFPQVRAPSCHVNLEEQKVLIQLYYMQKEQKEAVRSCFVPFLDKIDVSVNPHGSGYNNASIVVKFDAAERDKVLKGLQLTSETFKVQSYQGQLRC